MYTLPGEVFLENSSNIDPVAMSLEPISRTSGIATCLRDAFKSSEGFSEEAAIATLWQVEANLKQLEKVVKWQHEKTN